MLQECGAGIGLVDNLKKGQMPAADKIASVASYLGVTTDYLLGNTKHGYDLLQSAGGFYNAMMSGEEPTAQANEQITLTEDELKLLEDYRAISNQGKEFVNQFMAMTTKTYKKHDIFDDAEFSKELG